MPGINNFYLQDQGSKFPSLLGSGINILSEKMGSVVKKYTSLLPWKYDVTEDLRAAAREGWVQNEDRRPKNEDPFKIVLKSL